MSNHGVGEHPVKAMSKIWRDVAASFIYAACHAYCNLMVLAIDRSWCGSISLIRDSYIIAKILVGFTLKMVWASGNLE